MRLFLDKNSDFLKRELLFCLKNIKLLDANITYFPCGECDIQINEDLQGQKIILYYNLDKDINKNIFEICLFANILKQHNAEEILLFLPYFPYSRHNSEKFSEAELIIKLLKSSFIDRLISFDLHNEFHNPILTNINMGNFFLKQITNLINAHSQKNFSLVAPDKGAVKKLDSITKNLNIPKIYLTKQRIDNKTLIISNSTGEIKDQICIIIDDIIDTASTIIQASNHLKQNGAKETYVFATHGIFSGDAIEKINNSEIDQIFVASSRFSEKGKIKKLPISELIANIVSEF